MLANITDEELQAEFEALGCKFMKKIKTQADIPSDWKVLNVRKKTTVQIRPCNGVEEFEVSWQDSKLVSDPEVDLIVIQPNGTCYPCKRDIFYETYVAHELDRSLPVGMLVKTWIKKATSQIVEIPEDEAVEIETLEGTLNEVTWPDYIAIGVKGELYANTLSFVRNNLEIL